MNILLLTPGINKKFNDNYYAYRHIAGEGHRVMAISNRQNILKGSGTEISPVEERDGQLEVRRVFETLRQQRGFPPARLYAEIRKLASGFHADVIFCENSINMPVAVRLKRELGIPLVLRVEDFYDPRDPYATIGYRKFIRNRVTGDLLGRIAGPLVWKWLCRNSDALITHNPSDRDRLPGMRAAGMRAFYIPWPGKELVFAEPIPRDEHRAVYIGSFDVHKNIAGFRDALPRLFEGTPLTEMHIVGDGRDAPVVEDLCRRFSGKVRHTRTLPREECLRLIAGSFFCFLPATGGAWGFIGDAWAMKTPLVVTSNHYDFHDGVDAVVADPKNIAARVNRLYGDRSYYAEVAAGGYRRFNELHRAEKVGDEYLSVCRSVLSGERR